MLIKNSFHARAYFNDDKNRGYTPTHWFSYEGKYIGSFIMDEDDNTIWNLSIKEEYRNQGYGLLMMQDILVRFGHRPVYLYVENDNTAAMHLYQKVGFRVCGKHPWADASHMEWRREFV